MTATNFNTIQYCINNNLPCFSAGIGWDREKGRKIPYFPTGWQKLESPSIKEGLNALVILTGKTLWGIDFDNCFERLPEATQKLFWDSCGAIVKTPRGYHFYFLVDSLTDNFNSPTKISVGGKRYLEHGGIDVRAKGGCFIAPPTLYKAEGEERKYEWIKGDLSTAKAAPEELLGLLDLEELKCVDTNSVITSDPNNCILEDVSDPESLPSEKWDEIAKLVDMLSEERATDYCTWRDVIFCLKNTEFSERMLGLCHEFSKKSGKYDPRSVDRKFYSRTTKEKILTAKSLYYWAKIDSPIEYQVLLLSREYSKDDWLYEQLTDGQVSLANIYYKLYGQDLLLVYDSDRKIQNTFYMFNYESRLWNPITKEVLSSDISTKLSVITRDLLKRFIDASCDMDKNLGDDKVKEQKRLIDKKIKELRHLHLAIQDIKKGFSIACHVINCKQKSQYDNVKMNKNSKYLSVLNGMVDLETGELLERTHEHYQTFHIPVNYNPNADTSLMEKFIDNMFKPNEKDVQRLLCSVLGYAISGVADQKCMPIVVGDGDNGKSQLINILEEILPGYFGKVEYGELSATNTNVNNDSLYKARFARIMIIIETDKNAKLNEKRLKNISGKDKSFVSGKFKAAEQMSDECIPFIVSNFKPEFTGDKAIWSRVLMIPLNMQFLDRGNTKWDEEAFKAGEIMEKNGEFIKELYSNNEGILKWIVDQSRGYFKDGFRIPETVRQAKEKYMNTCMKKENTDMDNYIKNTWVIDNKGDVEMKTILDQYREDFPNDALLSDGQIQNRILPSIKALGAINRRLDFIINGKRETKTIWTIKKK